MQVAQIAIACEVSPEAASAVQGELYGNFARKVADDGVITTGERFKLDKLANMLGIDADRARKIEDEENLKVYQEVVAKAHADGIVTTEEATHLAKVRRSLGISDSTASTLPGIGDDATTSAPRTGLEWMATGEDFEAF